MTFLVSEHHTTPALLQHGHVVVVQDSMSIFHQFDTLNDLQFGSWYVAQIEVLQVINPWLYRRFSMEQVVVLKWFGTLFSEIVTGMKLKQTMHALPRNRMGNMSWQLKVHRLSCRVLAAVPLSYSNFEPNTYAYK